MEGFDTITMSSYLAQQQAPDALMLPLDGVSNFDNETFFGCAIIESHASLLLDEAES